VSINNDKVIDSELPIKPLAKKITTNAGEYEIVLGCFTVLGNANKMVANLADKNVAAFVSGTNHKGMHVVSVGNFSTKNQALTKLTEIKSSFPHAWIKKP
jgi:cell division septation protein DedD